MKRVRPMTIAFLVAFVVAIIVAILLAVLLTQPDSSQPDKSEIMFIISSDFVNSVIMVDTFICTDIKA